MAKQVTEDDLRVPEFRGVDVSELEFREDGKIMRKDRWERGLKSIAMSLGFARGFEIEEVITQVDVLANYQGLYEAGGEMPRHLVPCPVGAIKMGIPTGCWVLPIQRPKRPGMTSTPLQWST